MSDTIAKSNENRINPYLTAFVILLPGFISLVASSATNTCQNHIAGYFAATPYETNSVITAYMIAAGVTLPVFGWVVNIYGKKNVAYFSLIMFALGALMCILVHDLYLLIIARVIQGVGSGCLLPLSQQVLLEVFPPEKKSVAMGLFGFAAMFAPLAGPAIGGYLTDNYSWQWVFIINIPLSIISIPLVKYFVPDSHKKGDSKKKEIHVDIPGLMGIIIGMGCLQMVLDKGEQYNWFDTPWIYWCTMASVVAFVFFYVWELEYKHPIVKIRVFKNINFLVGTTISAFINILLYSTLLLIPMFVQNILGYSPSLAGLTVLPRAIACLIGLFVFGEVARYVENRLLTVIGFLILSYSVFMFSSLNNEASMAAVILPNILLGIGISCAFVPITALSFLTLKKDMVADATGMHAFFKNIVTAASTALSSTFIARVSEVHQNYLVENMSRFNLVFQNQLAVLQSKFGIYFSPFIAAKKANGFLYKEMIYQSKMSAFYDLFQLLSLLCLLVIPLILFMRVPKKPSKAE